MKLNLNTRNRRSDKLEIETQLQEIIMTPHWDDMDALQEYDERMEREQSELWEEQREQLQFLQDELGDDFDEYAYWNNSYYKWKERRGLNPLSLSGV